MNAKKMLYVAITVCLIFVVIMACESSGNNAVNQSDEKNNSQGGSSNNQQNAGSSKEGDKYGGTVKIRFHETPRSIGYPATMSPPSNAVPVGQPAMESLGRFKPDGTMGPWLAESWKTDPAAKTITVNLRKGIKFHDGTDFDAAAVKWNIDSVLESKRPISTIVDSVEVVDTYTVVFHLKMWANSALSDLFWTYPMASPTAFKTMGQEGLEKHPVGTGPFKFDSMQNDVYVKYVRNENYWQKGLPYLDSIEFKIIVEPNTALNSFLGNEVDVALLLPGDLVANLKGRKDIELVDPTAQVGLLGTGLIANSANPKSPFADIRVRKAIDYAINKKELAEVLTRGFATAVNQYSMNGAWTYDPKLEAYEYNPEKAKELLKEAGYPNGFSTKLIGHASHRTWLTAVQGYLAEVGIKAEVVIVEPARFNAMAMTDGWDGLIGYFFLTDNELSTIINPHFGPNTAIYGTYALRPEKVQKLNDQFNAETDFEKRKQLAHELQSTILDEYHLFTPLFVSKTPYLKYSKVQDDQFYTQNGMLFSPEKMWIKKK